MKNTARSLGSWLFSAFVLLGLIGLFASAPSNLFAQAAEVAEAATPAISTVGEDLGRVLVSFLAPLVTQHPWIATVLLLVGVLRSVFKPIVTVLEQRAAATADTADDERLKKAEASWWFRALAWLLDFGASIKVGPQKR